ncbi:lipopolysaccharide biosynthesis protein [Nakamurella sp.]|uniref:lipopolysaccharide biosynthesis protein n=1 Tax=Nakamurella sp. TaxID=1869182 RepID=UPI003B3A54EE
MTRAAAKERSGPATGADRDRLVAFGMSTAVVARAVGLIAPLIITPVCFRYLGDQRYGLWMAVTALTAMAWLTDLGLGSGLLTRLGQLAGDQPQQAREISSAYASVFTVAAALFGGLLLVNPLIPWADLFGVTDPAIAGEAPTLVLMCFGGFALYMPLSLIQRVQYARGQTVLSNLWQTAGALVSVAGVLAAIAGDLPPLVVVGFAVFAIPATSAVNNLVFFGFQSRGIAPRPRLINRATLTGLLRLGLRFFVLTTIATVANNLDSPLIASTLGLQQAAHFALVSKLFAVVTMFVGLVGMTVWPVNGAALTSGDVPWVRRNTRRMILVNIVIVATIGLGLLAWGQEVLTIWVGGADQEWVPKAVFGWLGLWTLLVAMAVPMTMAQNSVGLLRPQLVGWLTFLPLATGLKVWGLHEFGLVAVPAAASLAYLVTMGPAVIIGYRRTLRDFARDPERSPFDTPLSSDRGGSPDAP